MKIYLVVGPPCGGKGTLLEQVSEMFVVQKISCGDICREEKQNQTLNWLIAEAYMKESGISLWPTAPLMNALRDKLVKLIENPAGGPIFLDGFPRVSDQVESLVKIVQDHGIEGVMVVDVETPDEVCIRRAESRMRPDDKDIRNRLDDYHAFTVPAVNKLMWWSDADSFSIEREILDGSLGKEDFRNLLYMFCHFKCLVPRAAYARPVLMQPPTSTPALPSLVAVG
jgi:adenylate kinase family enzyme